MKRYRLKKDLPKYKAGIGFRLTEKGHLAVGNTVVYHRKDLEKFPSILTDWFEGIPEKPKTVWDLEEEEECWALCWGEAHQRVWVERKDYVDMRAVGDIFLTRTEAERELARRKAKQILLRDTKGFKPDWGDTEQDKWYVAYHTYDSGELTAELKLGFNYGGPVFGSYNDARKSIKTHEKEWKIYLGVEG